MKEFVKIIPGKNKVVIRIFRQRPVTTNNFASDIHFELRSLCDIPILVFKLNPSEEIWVVAVNFRKIAVWPDFQQLPIQLQFFDLDQELVFFEKEILMSKEDTESVTESRTEQIKMKSRQIDAIVDFIYSDYIGFAQLAESL